MYADREGMTKTLCALSILAGFILLAACGEKELDASLAGANLSSSPAKTFPPKETAPNYVLKPYGQGPPWELYVERDGKMKPLDTEVTHVFGQEGALWYSKQGEDKDVTQVWHYAEGEETSDFVFEGEFHLISISYIADLSASTLLAAVRWGKDGSVAEIAFGEKGATAVVPGLLAKPEFYGSDTVMRFYRYSEEEMKNFEDHWTSYAPETDSFSFYTVKDLVKGDPVRTVVRPAE